MESIPNLGHLWSIGVEEQFYLFWPVFILYSKNHIKSIMIFIALLIGIKAGSYAFIQLFLNAPTVNPDLLQFTAVDVFQRFLGSLKFESMAIGALGACVLFEQKAFYLKLVFHKTTQLLAIIALPAIVLLVPSSLYKALYLLLSIPCLVVIMNVGCNPDSLIRFGNKALNYLGKISYGIYMYHLVCIAFAFHLVNHFSKLPVHITFGQNLLIYILSICFTIVLSAVSYRFIEKPFIRLKEKYTVIKSGEAQ
jgi:peptidoglycan/LPS O-acetylase OafA/YrhL